MTDRIAYLTVALDQDYRTDDVEAIVNAISMVRGVISVENGRPVDSMDHVNRERIRIELVQKLIDAANKK